MKRANLNQKYEEFHKTTTSQAKLINSNNFTYRFIVNIIDQYIESKKKILDIGCGAGTLSLYLANKNKNVFGIDISNKAIVSCKISARKLNLDKNATFKVMNFPDEVPKGKFDLILFFEVIEHLPDDCLSLRKIRSLLNKDGIAIISTPSINAPMHKLGLAKAFDERVGHLRRYSVEELVYKCIKSGFIILETRKNEGIVRNFLYLNPIAGKFIRFIKFYLTDIVSFIDFISLKLFGESNIFIVVKKSS